MEADTFFSILDGMALLVALVDAHWEAAREATVNGSFDLRATMEVNAISHCLWVTSAI